MAFIEVKGSDLGTLIPQLFREQAERQWPILREQYRIGIYLGEDAEDKIITVSPFSSFKLGDAANEQTPVLSNTYPAKDKGLVSKSLQAGFVGIKTYNEARPSLAEVLQNPKDAVIKNVRANILGAYVGVTTFLGK